MGAGVAPLPTPPVPPWALLPATITVSGYPAVAAACLVRGDTPLARAQQTADVLAYANRQELVFTGRGTGAKGRCHGCRKWAPLSELVDGRLGFDQYCDPCIQTGADVCLARHGRLPGEHEFFCLGCEWICDNRVRARPDADGRRRSRCVLCRTEQVRAADRRRRNRRSGWEP